jgi:hypothetical protein
MDNLMDYGVTKIKESTPIDTQRLFESVEKKDPENISANIFRFRIVIGGKSLYGVRRETSLKKDVNYAKYVESRYHFVRNSFHIITKNLT